MHNLALKVLSSLGEEPNGKIFMKALYNLKSTLWLSLNQNYNFGETWSPEGHSVQSETWHPVHTGDNVS